MGSSPTSPPTSTPTRSPTPGPTRSPTPGPTSNPTSGPTSNPATSTSIESTDPSVVDSTSSFEMVLNGVPPDTTMTTQQTEYFTKTVSDFIEEQIPDITTKSIFIEQQEPLNDQTSNRQFFRRLASGRLSIEGTIVVTHQAEQTPEEFAELLDETL